MGKYLQRGIPKQEIQLQILTVYYKKTKYKHFTMVI